MADKQPMPNLISLDFCREAAECLKVMAHPVRLRIVDILMQGEFPVRKIAEFCDLPHHQACEHLRLLKGQGFLDSERRGREVFYQIVSPRLPSLLNCVRNTCALPKVELKQ